MANEPYFLTWQEVLDQLLSYLPPSWRANMAGKVLKRLLVAFSLAVEALYALLARVTRLSVIATSEGKYLRSLVASIGMQAYGGVPATGLVRFKRYRNFENPVTILEGTQVGAQFGQIFATTETIYMPAIDPIGVTEQTADAPIICLESGITGNVSAGAIISILTPVEDVTEVTNLNPTTGGFDAETDVEIKARVPRYIESLHRATIPATEYLAVDRETFPEITGFLTQRNYGVPGYFRGIADTSGGDFYRAKKWNQIGSRGVFFVPCTLTQISGLVAAGFPCRRFGIPSRTVDGREVWEASRFVSEVEAGNWRYCLDTQIGRLYARSDGGNLNDLAITIVAGPIARIQAFLEDNWVANGVHIDVITPFEVSTDLVVSYVLEPEYTRVAVEQGLRAAIAAYIQSLNLGNSFEIEGLYGRLAAVPGAGGVLVQSPVENFAVPQDSVFRLANPAVIIAREI